MAAPRPNGNPRTDQANNFKVYDGQTLNRLRNDANQADAETKAEQAANRTDGLMLMNDLEQRWGRAIQVGQFKNILLRLQPKLIFELSKSSPDKYGIYVEQLTERPIPGTHGGYYASRRFICGMISGAEFGGIDSGYMPEFSVIVTESQVVPNQTETKTVNRFKREIRGWRTVLAALFMEKLITESQIEKTFKISHGKDSSNWQNRVNQPVRDSRTAGGN